MQCNIDREAKKVQCIGTVEKEIIDNLGLNLPPGKLFIGPRNLRHIKKKHPKEFEEFIDKIPSIISEPDYIGSHPRRGGIEYIKRLGSNLLVAVHLEQGDKWFVKSLYEIAESKLSLYIRSGTVIKRQKANNAYSISALESTPQRGRDK